MFFYITITNITNKEYTKFLRTLQTLKKLSITIELYFIYLFVSSSYIKLMFTFPKSIQMQPFNIVAKNIKQIKKNININSFTNFNRFCSTLWDKQLRAALANSYNF